MGNGLKKRAQEVEKTFYLYLAFGGEQFPLGELEYPIVRLQLAEQFGWTLDYVDSLDYETVQLIYATKAAEAKRAKDEARRAKGRR